MIRVPGVMGKGHRGRGRHQNGREKSWPAFDHCVSESQERLCWNAMRPTRVPLKRAGTGLAVNIITSDNAWSVEDCLQQEASAVTVANV